MPSPSSAASFRKSCYIGLSTPPSPSPRFPLLRIFVKIYCPQAGEGGKGNTASATRCYVAVVCTQRRNIRAIKVPRRGRGNTRKDRRDMGKMSCRYCPEAAPKRRRLQSGKSKDVAIHKMHVSFRFLLGRLAPHCDCGGVVVVRKMHHRSLISRSAAATTKRKSRPNFPGRRQRKLGSHYVYFKLRVHMYELGCSTCDACFWVYTLHARIENEDGDEKKRMRRRPSLSSFPLLTFPPSK